MGIAKSDIAAVRIKQGKKKPALAEADLVDMYVRCERVSLFNVRFYTLISILISLQRPFLKYLF